MITRQGVLGAIGLGLMFTAGTCSPDMTPAQDGTADVRESFVQIGTALGVLADGTVIELD